MLPHCDTCSEAVERVDGRWQRLDGTTDCRVNPAGHSVEGQL